ncbi:MAG: hypothetical protein WEB30_08585 [Cyclobacteriaceae bacterium]
MWQNIVAGWSIAWSPDGRMIAFSDEGGIHTLNLDDFKVRKVVDRLAVGDPSSEPPKQPSWSPDGGYLAFVATGGSFCIPAGDCYDSPRIFIASLNSPGITNPVIDSLLRIDFDPAWSPNGKKIAFSSVRRCAWDYTETNSDIYIMNLDGTEVTRLTKWSFHEGQPVWSPDGKKSLSPDGAMETIARAFM